MNIHVVISIEKSEEIQWDILRVLKNGDFSWDIHRKLQNHSFSDLRNEVFSWDILRILIKSEVFSRDILRIQKNELKREEKLSSKKLRASWEAKKEPRRFQESSKKLEGEEAKW